MNDSPDSNRFVPAALGVALCALIAAPASAETPAEAQCHAKIDDAGHALDGTVKTAAEAEARLVRARPMYADAIACAKATPAFARYAPRLADRLAQAETLAKQMARFDALVAEWDKLRQTLADDRGGDDQALHDSIAAWKKEVVVFERELGLGQVDLENDGYVLDRLYSDLVERHAKQAAADQAKAARDAIDSRLVTAKLGRTIEDSYDLAKIEAALLAADPSMFVTVNGGGLRWRPSLDDGEGQIGLPDCPDGDARLGKVYTNMSGYLAMRRCTPPRKILAHAVGLLWAVDHSTVIFVTVDGGRYLVDIGESGWFTPGLPADGAWAPPVVNEVAADELASQGQSGAKGAAGDVWGAQQAWRRCYERVWAPSKAEYDANDASDIRAETRQIRAQQLGERYNAKSEKVCAPQKQAFAKIAAASVAKYDKQREALYAKVKARLTAAP